MFELKSEVVSSFEGDINGVKFDREHIYNETLYLLEDENIMDGIQLGDVTAKDFVSSLKNYMEHKIYGKDWNMKNIIEDLDSEDDLVSYITGY